MQYRMPKQAPIFALAVILTVSCASLDSLEPDSGPSSSTPSRSVFSNEHAQQSELMYRLLAGELAGHLGDLEQSVAHYAEAVNLSDDPKVAARATRIALYAERVEDGLVVAKRWVELAPDNHEARQTLAILYVRNDQAEQAIPHFRHVIDLTDAAGQNGLLLVSAALGREKDAAAALETMRQLVESDQDNPEAHFAYGTLALAHKRFRLAANETTKALVLQPAYVEARIVRARARFNMDELEAALTDMKAASAARPENEELHANYGRMLVQSKRYDEARTVFTGLLNKRPENPDLLYMLGLLNLQDERYDAAEQSFKGLAATDKRVDEAHYYLGRVAQVRSQYPKAMDWYGKVSEGEYFLDAQTRIADLHRELGDLPKARAHLKQLRDRASDGETIVKLYLSEGQVLREAGKFKEGMEVYNRALTEHPRNGDLLYARALMAEKINRIDLLEADLRAILADDPGNATALNALGYTLADRNERIPEAYEYIQRALKERPDDPTVIDSMGWVQFRMGNYDAAEQYLRKAYDLLQDAEIAGHLTELIWVKGNKSEARDLLNKALEKDPDHDYLLELKARLDQ